MAQITWERGDYFKFKDLPDTFGVILSDKEILIVGRNLHSAVPKGSEESPYRCNKRASGDTTNFVLVNPSQVSEISRAEQMILEAALEATRKLPTPKK